MNRRTILQLTGATFATGLAGTESVAGQGDDGDGETDTDRPGEAACQPDVRLGDQDMIVDESGFSPTVYAAVEVQNEGDAATGEIDLTVEWVDGDGNFVDDDSARLPSLGGGETWLAYVEGLLLDPADVGEFAVVGDFSVGPPRTPHGIHVAESEFDYGENTIAGIAENTREQDLESIEALGKIYAGDGTVLGGSSTREWDLPAGRSWNFEISTPRFPPGVEPTDHEVMLDSDSFAIR